MRVHGARRAWKIVLFVVIVTAALSVAVTGLWNALLPPLFGFARIGYVQALGLLLLARILFGGWRGPMGPGMHWRRRMMERWAQMSPEEREHIRAGMERGCGGCSEKERGANDSPI
jgi:hypothetical protein